MNKITFIDSSENSNIESILDNYQNNQCTLSDDEIINMDETTNKNEITEKIIEDFDKTISKKTKSKKTLEEKISAIDEEFKEDTLIDITNLKDKALMESAIKGKWASKLMYAKINNNKHKRDLETLCNELEKMYSESKNIPNSYLNSRRTIENMLNENTEVKKLRKSIDESKYVIEHLERLWIAIQGFGFTIKNSIETVKLEAGL